MFKAEKSALLSALALVGSVTEKRNTIPILQNVLIEREEDRLVARLTNLDIEAKTFFKAVSIDSDFQPFTVPASLLNDIVRKLPDGAEASIARPDGDKFTSIILKSGRSRFALQVLPAGDFPEMKMPADPVRVTIPADELSGAIGDCSHAISTEETRHYLNGIFFHQLAGSEDATFVATDGHRLVKRLTQAEISGAFPGVIIPRNTVRVLQKILPDAGGIDLDVTETLIRAVVGSTIITSKLIDGTFPDYQRVIPSDCHLVCTLQAKHLGEAVDRVATVSSERGRAVQFTFADQHLRLKVSNPDAGDAEDELAFEGEADLQIGFNARYVGDALAHLTGEKITLSLSAPGAPAILRSAISNPENLIVLMPMRA
ncbi:DNA polymerase III subunit beta [Rhizobium leguminosarum bv. trifolii]|uniref:DNA polymerase III subunit beta n=1 Tax=Rhizobium leguminosarum TaxID=384 RepID=UPI000E2F1B25|nr:DNA polymerase III subunit beta [Rhizobium leguminosarum]RFB95189.1 DNA polymerase III subunit beta [Rhizobium leguminosarum bv. trifolii]